MASRIVAAVLLSSTFTTTSLEAASCPTEIGHVPMQIGGAIAFRNDALAVDADGAPNSYLIDGNGLSRTCDGVVAIVDGKKVEPSQPNWNALCDAAWAHARESGDYSQVSIFGFYADPKTNIPAVQGPGDPLPGTAFVSTTSLSVPGAPETSQRHWVDATAIPYVVLTKNFVRSHGVGLGDVAVVYVPSSGKLAYAVFADEGPALGEASVKLHTAIGSNPVNRHHGVDRADAGFGKPVIMLVFPGKRAKPMPDAEAWNQEIAEVGKKAFEAWGGLDMLKGCLR